MNALMSVGEVQTMSSREIAELTGKRHDNVLRDIEKMAKDLDILDRLNFEVSEEINNLGFNVQRKVYKLNKEETLILVSGYSIKMRAAIIRRWQELEESKPKPALPVPQTYLEALKALVAAEEEKERLMLVLRQTTKYYDVLRVVKANPDMGLDARKLWRPLKNWCLEANVEIKRVFCPRYGSVNAYPYEAWHAVYPALELPQEAATLLEDMIDHT